MIYRQFTLVTPYYENPNMFREQQRVWLALPEEIRTSLSVLVVDDGSPDQPAKAHVLPEIRTALQSFGLLRLKVDVRWNWIGARNRGVEEAKTDWVLMTDMDHVIPAETWRHLMRGKLDALRAYRLSRVERQPDGTNVERNPHPNTWIMTRHMFRERVQGYDERFSGVYGSDGQFHRRVELWAQHVVLLPYTAIVYPDSVIPDACTTRYERKTDEDRARKDQIVSEIRGMGGDYTPLRLSFPWERVL